MWIAILVAVGALIFLLVAAANSAASGFPWVQFYVKGKESGFKIRELNLLRKIAVENRLKNPTSLFWSERTLDRCIRGIILRYRARGQENNPDAVTFLGKLFDFRKTVEMNQPKYRLGIQSTRSVASGQPIKITFPGGSVYYSKVVENMRKYMAIEYPKGKQKPPGFSWKGSNISVYFWRHEDAGYYFESKVIGDYLEQKRPILHITHPNDLVRTQKRNSVRAEISTNGQLFPLRSIKDASEKVAQAGGYRCKMVDISEDGAAVLVGGRAKSGIPMRIQTEINGEPVVLCGVVKGVTFKEKARMSILHLQAVKPSPAMRNRILTYVYGIFRNAGEVTSPAFKNAPASAAGTGAGTGAAAGGP